MRRWLFKSDPDDYSLDDLARDKQTAWTGVKNALARKHLRSVQPGDAVLIYHTGDEKAVVGLAKAASVSQPRPDESNDRADGVEIRFVKRFMTPVPLGAIKADPAFAEWELVTNSRLSIMPVSEKQWRRIDQLAGK